MCARYKNSFSIFMRTTNVGSFCKYISEKGKPYWKTRSVNHKSES